MNAEEQLPPGFRGLIVNSGPGYSWHWPATVGPYRVRLTGPGVDTTIPTPFPAYAWVGLPAGQWHAEAFDATGTRVATVDFEPVPVHSIAARYLGPEKLEVSTDLRNWYRLPQGYTYQADPAVIPKLFFRLVNASTAAARNPQKEHKA